MQVKKPAISILTPVWNGLPYIKETVASVFRQDFDDWELLISDNGSTDGTRDYLDTLNDPRVKIFKQQRNLGIEGNLNFLYTKASAEIAYCLCADDYFNAGTLKLAVEEWSRQPDDVGLVVFNWHDIKRMGLKSAYGYEILPRFIQPSFSQLAFFLFGNFVGNISNISTRVKTVRDAGGFIESYLMAGDFEMWARIARTKSIAISELQVTYVRRHPGVASIYLNKQGKMFEEQATVYEELINHLEASEGFDRKVLVDFFNIEVCSWHLRESLRSLLANGRSKYFWIYISSKSKVFWPKWKRIFVSFPYAINERGRMNVLIKMANQLMAVAK